VPESVQPVRSTGRRDLLRILAIGSAAGVAWKLGFFDFTGARAVSESRILMGTGVRLTVLGDDREAAAQAVAATLDRMAAHEALLSRHRADSELSRLCATGKLEGASDALIEVLRLSGRIGDLGDGAFDVTVQPVLDLYAEHHAARRELPGAEAIERALATVDHRAIRIAGTTITLARPGMQLTLDGVGKGYVVDRGVEALRERGFANVFVDAGGDLVAAGDKGSGEPWRVGIRSPRPGLKLQARFDARDRAVATSGDYMQPFTPDLSQHHIVDPRTGYSAPELASSTVVARNAATADALATLTMVLGPRRGRELLEELPDCEGYMVSKDLAVTRTSGFPVA
jgi:thiamine biosynthesis lipoprotein